MATTTMGAALLAAQKDAPALQKNAINPHFKNRYISLDNLLEQVLPVLNKHGLVLTQQPTIADGEPALTTRLIHAESGEQIEDTMLLVPGKPDPQGQGSAITYARRYSLMALLGLVADEDDDANGAARPAPQQTEYVNQSGVGSSDVMGASEKQVGFVRRLVKEVETAGLAQKGVISVNPSMTKSEASELIEKLQRLKENGATVAAGVDDDIPFMPTIDGAN